MVTATWGYLKHALFHVYVLFVLCDIRKVFTMCKEKLDYA